MFLGCAFVILLVAAAAGVAETTCEGDACPYNVNTLLQHRQDSYVKSSTVEDVAEEVITTQVCSTKSRWTNEKCARKCDSTSNCHRKCDKKCTSCACNQEEPSFDYKKYSNTMSATIGVKIDGEFAEGKLTAYANGVICGEEETTIAPPFGPLVGKPLFAMMLYADTGNKKVTFKFKPEGGEEVDLAGEFEFDVNGNKGNVLDPFILSFTEPVLEPVLEPVVEETPALPTEFDYKSFENSMTAVIGVEIDHQYVDGKLVAFVGDEVRGIQGESQSPPFGRFMGKPLFWLMMYADKSGETVTFKFETTTGDVVDLRVQGELATGDEAGMKFVTNDNPGNALDPVILSPPKH